MWGTPRQLRVFVTFAVPRVGVTLPAHECRLAPHRVGADQTSIRAVVGLQLVVGLHLDIDPGIHRPFGHARQESRSALLCLSDDAATKFVSAVLASLFPAAAVPALPIVRSSARVLPRGLVRGLVRLVRSCCTPGPCTKSVGCWRWRHRPFHRRNFASRISGADLPS